MQKLLTGREVDRLLRYPRGRSIRLAKSGHIPYIRLPDGEIRFELDLIEKMFVSNPPPPKLLETIDPIPGLIICAIIVFIASLPFLHHRACFISLGAVDLFSEELASLTEATKWREWPRRRAGKRPHISCLIRWVKDGSQGVHLEAVKCGGTLCTTKPAVGRFLRRLTELDGIAAPTRATNPDRAEVEADAILDAAGV